MWGGWNPLKGFLAPLFLIPVHEASGSGDWLPVSKLKHPPQESTGPSQAPSWGSPHSLTAAKQSKQHTAWERWGLAPANLFEAGRSPHPPVGPHVAIQGRQALELLQADGARQLVLGIKLLPKHSFWLATAPG